ncbi:HMG (high mobility group) box [Geosmithia morbida]|uniref:HMG (High mobility group) box n=1 Tax=Geosmithia morbida TaxID=1094350 RepID=A0A9P4YW20_9HYPO|nr:HMG (high mobility group) box [Geosmithia morbida]KAF4123582.1 HMG (high mobility group) box [Geosmithia morbida]
MAQLEATFRELGLIQYLGTFVDQGFDTWDTILDIQESDLRIANARGVAPSTSLSSSKPSSDEGKSSNSTARPSPGRTLPANSDGGSGVVKRKYRRHPKPDENAPERPPSAYVLFSNKMRDDLKGQNLTFTEIAKLVGENWQSLPPAEKETYESQANSAKEEYHRNLAEYKKTSEYRKHAQYLADFKEKQAKRDQGRSGRQRGLVAARLTNITDVNKRSKVELSRYHHESSGSSVVTGVSASSASSRGSTTTSTSASTNHSLRNSRSSSERTFENEKRSARQRMDSISSIADSHKSMSPVMPDAKFSPLTAQHGERDMRLTGSAAVRDTNAVTEGRQHLLPSLSDVLDNGLGKPPAPASDGDRYARPGMAPGATQVACQPPMTGSRHQPLSHPSGLPPMLRHEDSSRGSSTSVKSDSPATSSAGTSMSSFSRPQGEGSLPIHALLENRPTEVSLPIPSHHNVVSRTNIGGSAVHMKVEDLTTDDVVMTSPALELASAPAARNGTGAPAKGSKNGLDGMSALLRAGEIVNGRHNE